MALYKKGPNGTLRKYSKLNGKYVKESPEELLMRFCGTQKKKHSKKEKEEIRRENVRRAAESSTDVGLFDVYSYIEQLKPGCTQLVNANVNFKKWPSPPEIDIVTKRLFIEVKSKKAKRCLTQFLHQIDHAKEYGRRAVVFAPNISPARLQEYRSRGVTIFTKLEDIKPEDL